MTTITYQEACDMFVDAKCVSVPYEYHNMETVEPMQLYLGLLSKDSGEDLINATLSIDSKLMHIVSPSENYVVNNVTESEYDAFYICRAYETY